MRAITATEFKARCLRILDDVARTGQRVTILKHGRAVALLSPAAPAAKGYPQDSLKGTVETLGDIVAPAFPARAWTAERVRRR